jgi:hypothetical protein
MLISPELVRAMSPTCKLGFEPGGSKRLTPPTGRMSPAVRPCQLRHTLRQIETSALGVVLGTYRGGDFVGQRFEFAFRSRSCVLGSSRETYLGEMVYRGKPLDVARPQSAGEPPPFTSDRT